METTYRKSSSGKSILVSQSEFDEFGLPLSNKLGVIRPKEGSDVDMLVGMLQGGKVRFDFSDVQNKDNGIYEMTRMPNVTVGTEEEKEKNLVETTK